MGNIMSDRTLGRGPNNPDFPHPSPLPISSSFGAYDSHTAVHDECRTLLLNIKGHPDKKARLLQLKDEDAQCMVDFLCEIAHERGILNGGRFVLSRLRDLAKKNGVFPRYYELTKVRSNFHAVQGGSYADICRGEYKSQQLGLKMIRIFEGQTKAHILKIYVKELALWAQLAHANILPFYGVYLYGEAKRICLVSPWMKNGNLHGYLQLVPEAPRLLLISDIVEGLHYLHSQKIVHGDLKSTNVLISDDGRAMIGDFGLSYLAVASGMASSSGLEKGAVRWRAPELLQEDAKQTLTSDIWSFGCLCYEVTTRRSPFYRLSDAAVVLLLARKIDHTTYLASGIDTNSEYDKVDGQVWKTIKECWNYEPSSRPTCGEIHTAIAGTNILDTRPKITTKVQDGLSFRQAMRANSNLQIDYRRARDILRGIHQTE